MHRIRPAFTLLELVFVIIVIGILATLSISRVDRDLRQEASDNLLSAIRYTQHLALIDDKTNPYDPTWQSKLWKIRFSTSALGSGAFFYTISSDLNSNGAVSKNEAAIDPANGKYMYNNNADTTTGSDESPNIFIGKKYGINSIAFGGGCGSQHIAFDHLGRPHNGIGSATNDYSKYMTRDCTITIGFGTSGIDPLTITIAAETGYVSAD